MLGADAPARERHSRHRRPLTHALTHHIGSLRSHNRGLNPASSPPPCSALTRLPASAHSRHRRPLTHALTATLARSARTIDGLNPASSPSSVLDADAPARERHSRHRRPLHPRLHSPATHVTSPRLGGRPALAPAAAVGCRLLATSVIGSVSTTPCRRPIIRPAANPRRRPPRRPRLPRPSRCRDLPGTRHESAGPSAPTPGPDEPRRYNDLARTTAGVSQKMLTQTLRTHPGGRVGPGRLRQIGRQLEPDSSAGRVSLERLRPRLAVPGTEREPARDREDAQRLRRCRHLPEHH